MSETDRHTGGRAKPTDPDAQRPRLQADRELDHLPAWAGALAKPLGPLDDTEGDRIPPGLPPVVDSHVHVFPEPLMGAVRSWFHEHGWPVRYPLTSKELIEYLLSRGVAHLVLLHYAHRPGMARDLNRYVADLCRGDPRLTGLATVFPGEDGTEDILDEAVELGLKGVKLHTHVQCFDVGGPEARRVCRWCADRGLPLVAHFGREPKSPAYRCDPHRLCSAARVEALLQGFPELRLCVPHLGADEFEAYRELIEQYENLWLDTTMVLAGYLPGLEPPPLNEFRADRVMYGTDFCNLPFAWDRELRVLAGSGLEQEHLGAILWRNAAEFFSIDALLGDQR